DSLVRGSQAVGFRQCLERFYRLQLLRHHAQVDGLLAQDRVDLQRGITLLLEVSPEAIKEKVAHLRMRLRGERLEGGVDQLLQRQMEPVFDQDADRAERRAPQSERVLVPGRLLADAEEARD